MSSRTAGQTLALIAQDLTGNRGRRLRHGLGWRVRRVRNRARRRWRRRHPRETQPQKRIYSVSFGPRGERVFSILVDRLSELNIPMMTGGGSRKTVRTVHIAIEDIRSMCECLIDHASDVDLFVRVKGKRSFRKPLDADVIKRLEARARSFDLLIVESRVGEAPEHVQCSRIEVAVWREHSPAERKTFRESDRSFAIVGRLRGPKFDELMGRRHDFDLDFAAPGSPDFAIDVVYTWVDGDDPDWQQRKAEFGAHGAGALPERVLHEERFRSRDELKYSLRSLHLFAPWVRQIHIVTAGQRPEWLNVDHPKINLVNHTDIFSDPGLLPTFNSSGIETQLHRVPGVAQKFLYFNDDFLLGQLSDPQDFFHSNGVLKFFPSDQRAYEGDIDERSEEYIQADKNATELFKKDFPSTGRSIMRHVPYPCDRDLLAEMETRYRKAFARAAKSRFRSSHDLRPIAFMQYHYGYQAGRAMPDDISHRYLALWKPSIVEQLAKVESSRSYKTICINDVGLQPERLAEVNEAVAQFLEAYYPMPSPYEITPP